MAIAPSTPTRVTTGTVRLSYAHLFEPHAAFEGQDPKFSCVIMIPKSDTATYEKLRKAQQVALEEGKNTKFGGKIPKNWGDTIKDGDEDADLDQNPEYAGHWYLSVGAQASRPPVIVDRRRQQITDPTEVYSGCYARVSLNAFAYSVQVNKGVSFGLNAVQKVADGEQFGGGKVDIESTFDDLGDDEDEGDII